MIGRHQPDCEGSPVSITSDSSCGDPISSRVLLSFLSYASPPSSLAYGIFKMNFAVIQPLGTFTDQQRHYTHRKHQHKSIAIRVSPPHVRSTNRNYPRPNQTSLGQASTHSTPLLRQQHLLRAHLAQFEIHGQVQDPLALCIAAALRTRLHSHMSDSLTLAHLRNALHWGLGVSANTAALSALRSHTSRLRLPTYLEPEVVHIEVPSRAHPAVLTHSSRNQRGHLAGRR